MRVKRKKPHKCIDKKNSLWSIGQFTYLNIKKRKDNEKLKILKDLILTNKKI